MGSSDAPAAWAQLRKPYQEFEGRSFRGARFPTPGSSDANGDTLWSGWKLPCDSLQQYKNNYEPVYGGVTADGVGERLTEDRLLQLGVGALCSV